MDNDLNTIKTRTALLKIARTLFSEKGFSKTSVAEIARSASVTTGAIYHQFANKAALFRAVAEVVEEEIMRKVINAAEAAGPDPYESLLGGVEGMLDAIMEPELLRIAFIEAPTVFGSKDWRNIKTQYAYGLLLRSLQKIEESGDLKGLNASTLAPMILGVLTEAAMTIAQSENKINAQKDARKAIRVLLSGLR